MDPKSLSMLEFPKVREILAGFTDFSISYDMAANLVPSSDLETVSELLSQSAEARQFLAYNHNYFIGRAVDIREYVSAANRGKVLEPLTLRDIRSTMSAAKNFFKNIQELAEKLPSLWKIARHIYPLPHLEHEIDRCINADGEILDSASEELADIRTELKEVYRQMMNRLESIIKADTNQIMLQETLITERGGRYVIPVKIEFQNTVKGIIHDISNTGATAFIEPMATVELGNKLRQLALEEQREIVRILTLLSGLVAADSETILDNTVLLAELDLVLAKAKYARSINAIEPCMVLNAGSIKGGIKLVNARHPLLPQSKAVPITVGVGDDFSVLIITGPNTGGKTVSLKTIGLLVLMTQAGIPIPADESSQIPIFDNIFADIGDEQSIEQTLSTFSWHMSNIVRIIQTSTSNSLVLLDELGISTDPTEGAALARAIMLHFLARQTLTVVTTHYSELKVFAHATEGMQNASLEFDPVTLTPTYHLTLGIPGGSNALAIASKLGLPDEIIDSAKEMLSSTAQEIDELLADLTRETQATRNMRLEIEKERKEIGSIRSSIDNELQELRERERIVIQDVRERLADEAALLHQQIRKASTELKKKKSKENIEKAKKELKSVREHLDSPEWKTEDELKEVPTGEVIAIGDMVKVIDTNLKGLVLSISEKNQVEIQVGKTRFKVDAGELVKTDSQIEPEAPSRRFTIQRDVESKRRSIELDLRGKRADEVEPELDAYLNDTSIAGFNEVRIIHGYGTGTVRQIVRDMLASHPLVRSFRTGGGDEGGDGVTVAHL